MKILCKNIFRILASMMLVCCLLCEEISAQYQGGIADGQAGLSLASTIGTPVYCHGGPGNGHTLLAVNNTIGPPVYCSGGSSDGSASLYSLATISNPVYASGGNSDGMSCVGAFSTIGVPFYCQGGDEAGFSVIAGSGLTSGNAVYCYGGNEAGFGLTGYQGLTNGTAMYCQGGDADGSIWILTDGTISHPFYCTGGNYDGFAAAMAPEFFMGQGMWNGYVSTNWNNAANWSNNAVPDQSSDVVIPGGCLFYPVLSKSFSINDVQFGNIHCEELTVKNGATFYSSAPVRINGMLDISGQYYHSDAQPSSFQVTPQGNVTIRPGGALLIQQ